MASVRARGSRFTGLYRDAAGAQRSAGSFNYAEEAMLRAQVLELDAQPPKTVEVYPTSRKGRLTVAGYGPSAIATARLAETTREGYMYQFRKRIAPVLGSTPVADLTPADVRAFARKIESGNLSGATVQHAFGVLKLIIRTAVQDELLTRDVTAGVSVQRRAPGQKIIATPSQAMEIERLINPRYALLVRTMFATGMRFGELMALKPSDVQDRVVDGVVCGKVIQVSRAIVELRGKPVEQPHGKTDHARRKIPVSPDLALALTQATGKDGRIFLNSQGGYIGRSNFARVWKTAVEHAGIPGMTPHGARHSLASWLANDPSVPLVAVRDMLGHASIAHTSVYVHMIDAGDDPRLAALARMVP